MKLEELDFRAWPPMQGNAVSKGVKIIHKPTGIESICTKHRAQYKNKEEALQKLKVLIDGD